MLGFVAARAAEPAGGGRAGGVEQPEILDRFGLRAGGTRGREGRLDVLRKGGSLLANTMEQKVLFASASARERTLYRLCAPRPSLSLAPSLLSTIASCSVPQRTPVVPAARSQRVYRSNSVLCIAGPRPGGCVQGL